MLKNLHLKIGLLMATVGVLVGCSGNTSEYETKVINGTVYDGDIDRDGVNTATVRIWLKKGNTLTACTATRVAERSFLTAAHCFYSQSTVDALYIKTGYASVYDGIKDNFTLEDWTIHPDHIYLSPPTFDLALFRVGASDVTKLGKVKIASVAFNAVAYHEPVTIWGYGCAARGGSTDGHKRYGKSILSDSSALGSQFRYVNLTSADLDSTDPVLCEGDSGGPLVQYGNVIGVNTGYRTPYSYYARLDLSNVKIWYADFVERD